jgi:hypothetical protein
MPRQSAHSQTSRRTVTDQETFDFSTPNLQVSARPVDAFARPMGVSGSTRALMQAFATGKEAYQQHKEYKEQKDFEAGSMAKATGQEQDTSKSAAWITGYEAMSGEAAAADLRDALEKFHTENWQADPDSYAAGREEIVKGFLDGKSEAYLKNFVPQAVKLEEHYSQAYQKAQLGQLQQDAVTNARKAMRVQLDDILQDPSKAAESPKILRAKLTTMQGSLKQYGLSRTAVSKQIVEAVGMRAVLEGMPELMAFAMEPDDSGMALADNPELADSVLTYVKQAETARDAGVTAAKKAEKENQEKLKDTVERTLVEKFYALDPKDRAGRMEALQILHNAGAVDRNPFGVALDPGQLEHYYKVANELMSGGGNFAQEYEPKVYQDLWIKAAQGTLSMEELDANQSSLTRDVYKALIQENCDARGRKSANGGNPFDPTFTKLVTDMGAVLNKSSMFEIDKMGPDKVQEARMLSFKWYLEYQKANDGKAPSMMESYEQIQKIQKLVGEKYDGADWGATSAGTGNAGAPATSQKEIINSRVEQLKARGK